MGGNPDSSQILYNGNIYGVASIVGAFGYGGVFELKHSHTGWIESLLYSFTGASGDGAYPYGGVVFDKSGNLYGTTDEGGAFGYGTVLELAPSGSGWTETVLYSFTRGGDGAYPFAGVILDKAGNLYGSTYGNNGPIYGSAFELQKSGSSFTEHTLYTFSGGSDGAGPAGQLALRGGKLYGAAYTGGTNNVGVVYEIIP